MPSAALILGVPGGGQIGHVQIVVQQILFELKANQDVQVVGHFVGFHADQRRPHVVGRKIELFQRDVLQSLGVDLLGRRKEM